jgi:hypothetical protein
MTILLAVSLEAETECRIVASPTAPKWQPNVQTKLHRNLNTPNFLFFGPVRLSASHCWVSKPVYTT